MRAQLKNNAFIGMQSTIMDKAIIEEYAFYSSREPVTLEK